MRWLKGIFGKPDRVQFGPIFLRNVRRYRPETRERKLVFSLENFSVHVPGTGKKEDKSENTYYLNNVYAEYLRCPRTQRKELFRRFIMGVAVVKTEQPKTFEEAKASVRIRVRERFYYEILPLHLSEKAAEMMSWKPFAEYLAFDLVLDYPDAIQNLAPSQIKEWGVSFEDVLAVAKDQLWKMSNKNFAVLSPGLWRSDWGDSYDSSRLYLHDLIWQLPVKGRHLAMVPTRNHLFVTGTEDVNGMTVLAAAVKSMQNEPRAMSWRAFILNDKTWEPWLPRDHPLYADFKKLQVESDMRDYAEQAAALEKKNKKEGIDVFVATCSGMNHPKAGPVTWCTWVDGIVSWLPRTDRVIISKKNEAGKFDGQMVAWQEMFEQAGDLMEPLGYWPPRYKVRDIPEVGRITAMNPEQMPKQG